MNDTVIFLMGPTASGKTALALELVKQLPLEVISVDSAMVYKGLDIGTAKPGKDVLETVPHRLIDICEPTETYSAGRFRYDALAAIEAICKQRRIPLLVGGTGLYFRTLEQGFSDLPATDPALRRRWRARLREHGSAALHTELRRVDPGSAARLHPHDAQRVQRALEVYEMTGRPLSALVAKGRLGRLSQTVIKLALVPADRQLLRAQVRQRFRHMLEQGLVDEVRGFYQREDMHEDLPSMRLVGYRQVWSYLAGQCDFAEMQERAVIATRQLAKRQLTWLRSEQNAVWFDPSAMNITRAVVKYLCENSAFSAQTWYNRAHNNHNE